MARDLVVHVARVLDGLWSSGLARDISHGGLPLSMTGYRALGKGGCCCGPGITEASCEFIFTAKPLAAGARELDPMGVW